MKLFNYVKVFGAFTNAKQIIELSVEPKDRQEKKMLEEANLLLEEDWARQMAWFEKREAEADEAFDYAAEKAAFYPKVEAGRVHMPLQYLQDYMVKKMAAIQNNTSIHNPKEVAELKEVFDDYGVELTASFKGLVFDYINWTARGDQRPKLVVHAKAADGEEIVIRFESSGELCQKFLNALMALKLQPGQAFDLSVEAVDPAIAKNKAAGRKVADLGKYVNHNLVVTVAGVSHTGHPPKGTRFVQKPTTEYMVALFRQAKSGTNSTAKAA